MNFKELEQLWIQAGGPPSSAPVAAAVALAESHGNPTALNDTPSTGDYSVGLWQINYYGSLAPGRTRAFGPPAGLTDPLKNAQAAVAVSSGGSSFNPWSTYKSGAYQQYLPGGSAGNTSGTNGSIYQAPPRPSGNSAVDFSITQAQGFGGVGGWVGNLPIIGGIIQGAKDATDAAKLAVWLFSPKHWAQMLEVLIGIALAGTGFYYFGSGDSDDADVNTGDVKSAFGLGKRGPSRRSAARRVTSGSVPVRAGRKALTAAA